MSDWEPPPPPPPPPPPGGQQGWGAPPPPPPPQGAYGAQQYGYTYGSGPPPQTEGMAVGALVCGIAAWVFFCFGFPLAIIGLVLAASARKKIQASGGRLTGDGLVVAAKWISIANLGLVALGTLLILVIAMLGSASDTGDETEFDSEFERIVRVR